MKRHSSRGFVAVEACFVLPLLAGMLVMVLLCGRALWFGSVLDKAVSASARYLSGVPLEALQDSSRRSQALAAARSLLDDTLRGAGITASPSPVYFLCGNLQCSDLSSSSIPASVTVDAFLLLDDSATALALPGVAPLQLETRVRISRGN